MAMNGMNMNMNMYTSTTEDVGLGDIVSVNIPAQAASVREGMVVGSHYDRLGRLVLEIQFDGGVMYNAWSTQVQKVRRTTTYYQPYPTHTRRYVHRYLEY
ncbi:hypothetical protein FRC19_004425 [Serendipita sp. 401]|nr:hypothetical protein FRC19_004425 [Serendipita sp. 401]